MNIIQRSALVRFPAQNMYKLVADIESYPKFLPWCDSSKILHRDGDVVEAKLEIVRSGFRKSFATRNSSNDQHQIKMSLIDGPFSYLEGVWTFLALREDACKISLDLKFELSGKIGNLAFGVMFNQICNTLVSAFTQRAKEIYG